MRPPSAAATAERLLKYLEPRWTHVRTVAALAEIIAGDSQAAAAVVDAAWLHDIGYAAALVRTGFHPLDGAEFLSEHGFSVEVVGLVAFHTGSEFESEERGLQSELARFRRPDQGQLDALILADLSVSPSGSRVHPEERVKEILQRYPPEDPVHRAVTRSRSYLMECASRAAQATGSPDKWGFSAA